MIFKISVGPIQRPIESNLNKELQIFGGSLGFFGIRDKDKSCFRIFIELVKNARQGYLVSSDELAYTLGLTRGTVIHHINKLMDARIVIVQNNRYVLRESNLVSLIEELRADLNKQLDELQLIAEDIDRKLELH